MSCIEFDLNFLENTVKKSNEINGEVSAALYDFRELATRSETECDQVVDMLINKINYLNSRIDAVRQTKSNVAAKLAQMQAAEEKSQAEADKNGARGSSHAGEISKLQMELDSISAIEKTVDDCINRLIACREKILGKQKEFEQKRATASRQFERVSDGMARFCSAISDTYRASDNILHCKIKTGGGTAFTRMFEIETTGHSFESGSHDSDYLDDDSFEAVSVDTKNSVASKCVVIKSRDIDVVISDIEGFVCGDMFKIPSVNFHALGANDFAQRIIGLGFEQVMFHGHIIDDNGYLVWRKK